MRRYTIAAIIGALILTACGSTSSPAASNCSKTWKVGLVTDVGKLSDKSFNYDSYQGVVNAQHDSSLCVQGRAIESTSENDYPKNIGLFVQQNYDAIVTVGFKLGEWRSVGLWQRPHAAMTETPEEPRPFAPFWSDQRP